MMDSLLNKIGNLSQEEKDDFYKTLAWWEIDDAEIDLNQVKAAFKAAQHLLREKEQQVETLLHELDELAVKKAEDEGVLTTAKSFMGGGIEYENLEQEHSELRAKFKKVTQENEKYVAEFNLLNKKIKRLEKENERLEKEVQARIHDESDSDISESYKQQQRELTSLVQSKNQQLSEILRDIEDVENENTVLREKLSTLKEELFNATNEIVSLTESLKAKDLIAEENAAALVKASALVETLECELDDVKKEKLKLEREIAEFSTEVESKVDKWKEVIASKNAEIEQLKRFRNKIVVDSAESSGSEGEIPYLRDLQNVISHRDAQLMELKCQMARSTKDMTENAEMLKDLRQQNELKSAKLEELNKTATELKMQCKKAHERCSNLQERVKNAEDMANFKSNELKRILKELKDNGQEDLAQKLTEIHALKTQNILQEQQIAGLVAAVNDLRQSIDELEKENAILRNELGIDDLDDISPSPCKYNTKRTKHRNDIEKLNRKLSSMQEEKVQLKMIVKDLKRRNSELSDQLIELGHKPIGKENDQPKSTARNSKELGDQIRALSEENEALRKGLHEILNSVNVKKESSAKEIKSEVLERLLKALDVKHISGWYHPAMRLQAELRSVEGANRELRDQLQQVRMELAANKVNEEISVGRNLEVDVQNIDDVEKVDSPRKTSIFASVIGQSHPDIDSLKLHVLQILVLLNEDNVESKLGEEFATLKKSLDSLHNECNSQRRTLEGELEEAHRKIQTLVEETAQGSCNSTDDADLKEKVVVLQRKATYLQKHADQVVSEREHFIKECSRTRLALSKKITELASKILRLQTRIKILREENTNLVPFEDHKKLESILEETLGKHRKLIAEIKEQSKQESLEMQLLRASQSNLEGEKAELKARLKEALAQAYAGAGEDTKNLAEKLAESQVKEISESQRAEHTNNLYELVKEQLNKSEDKFKEFSRYGENLLLKNLTLQEQLKDAENKLLSCVDRQAYKKLQDMSNELLKEKDELSVEVMRLNEELHTKRQEYALEMTWNDSKEQELLNLRHQIVDLVAVSEERILVGQLHADLAKERREREEKEMKIEAAFVETNEWKDKYERLVQRTETETSEFLVQKLNADKKNRILQDLLLKKKAQYFGSTPLCVDEAFLETLRTVNAQKHETFLRLLKVKELESENAILKHKFETRLEGKTTEKITDENMEFQLSRQCEFKDEQIGYLTERIGIQDRQIAKLEEELLVSYKNSDIAFTSAKRPRSVKLTRSIVCQESVNPTPCAVKIMRNVESQASFDVAPRSEADQMLLVNDLRAQIANLQSGCAQKEMIISQLNRSIADRDLSRASLERQIEEKQMQVSSMEKRLQEFREGEVKSQSGAGDGASIGSTNYKEETSSLRSLQDNVAQKDIEIMMYQTLLKEDRDKHSLAAANLQHELQVLQKALLQEKQKCKGLEESSALSKQKATMIEKYVAQVHALEQHLAELHTETAGLEARFQSSQQEVARWRVLAAERLTAMEELRKNLDDQHKKELQAYMEDGEKLREIVDESSGRRRVRLQKEQGSSSVLIDPDILKLVREKEEKIAQLTEQVRQLKSDKVKYSDGSLSEPPNLITDPDKKDTQLLIKENEILKRRAEQQLSKEQVLKNEIRELKNQLLKRPNFLSKGRLERSVKEQLQKRISGLEDEVEGLNRKLEEQVAINEKHKLMAGDDFEKWKKQKYWQENCEKLKMKLKEREEEIEKLRQTCNGFRLLIERLEREKMNLENRVKALKSANAHAADCQEFETLRLENARLSNEVEILVTKLEMQQHHSGGLGAAMLQEKLESQERKIAVLELSAKGSVQVRDELERLQKALSNMQKSNLCLEAENLELKMDLEKYSKETPHLQEQIQYLESYIELLKSEKSKTELEAKRDDRQNDSTPKENKTVSQLERTVFILKRVVEKLQAENKRLLSGKRPLNDCYPDKLKRDHQRLREQYNRSLETIKSLESQLASCNAKLQVDDKPITSNNEIERLRADLDSKNELLERVKGLLQRAAAKEKLLVQEITTLKNEREHRIGGGYPSPVQEESELSSDT
ncbi:centrosomal protein of 290 kDa-like isoform X2 [Cylas formicarius]|uniref:centrosomal protein of 290 kDa-like isoform X2 n=1 Tax=Cylas formicarius TaxID=197179 RepID=UPI0029589724|nr:centrosomal protein of 290 kDa-like isoform X2 [Cylas formicarius]